MSMETLQFCVETRSKVAQIKDGATNIKNKIMLLESLKQRLTEVHEFQKNKSLEMEKKDLNATFFTETQSILCRAQEDNLIDKILKKQKIKIEMDQQIETCDDDFTQITKIVETKQAYNDELGVRIALKTKQLQQQAKPNKLQKVKSTPSLFKIIFG